MSRSKELRLHQFMVLIEDLMFPNSDDHVHWQQEGYKAHFFDLCRESFEDLPADQLRTYLREQWGSPDGELLPPGKLNSDQELALKEILFAWEEWRYVLKKLRLSTANAH